MTLYLVTWTGDNTQFLVEAKHCRDAIRKAIEAHKAFHQDNWPDETEILKEITDEALYETELVRWELLCEIIKREDYIGVYKSCVAFNG